MRMPVLSMFTPLPLGAVLASISVPGRPAKLSSFKSRSPVPSASSNLLFTVVYSEPIGEVRSIPRCPPGDDGTQTYCHPARSNQDRV